MMRRANVLLASLALASLSACGAGGEDAAAAYAQIEQLLPDGTAAIVRIASLDEISSHMASIEMAAGEEKASLDARDLLAMAPIPLGEVRLIDGTLPIAIAVTSKRATPPTVTLIVPATDPKAYEASLNNANITSTTTAESSYFAVQLFGKYKPSMAGHTGTLANMEPGAVSIHGDLATFAKNYKVLIDSGLDMFVTVVTNQLETTNPGMDGEEIAELYASAARAITDSATTVDIGIDYQDGMLDFHTSLNVRDGSSMSGWSSPPIDLKPLAHGMTGKGMLEVLFQMDMDKLAPRYDAIVDTAINVYPEQFQEPMREMMEAYKGIYSLISDGMVMEGDLFGEGGIRMTAQMAPPNPAAFVEKMTELLTNEAVQKIGLIVKDAKAATDGATKTSDMALGFDFNKLAELVGGEATATPSADDPAIKAMFGSGFHLHTAHRSDRLVITSGKDRGEIANKTLDATSGTWSAAVQPAFERVADCNPMMVERIDFGAMMIGVMKAMGGPKPQSSSSANMIFYGGIRDNEWRLGMSFDVAGIAAMAKSVSPR